MAVSKDGVLSYLHSDHLNSASLATNTSGGKVAGSDIRYTPFGGTTGGSSMPTDRLYTGQREIASLDLYDYNARYYDPAIGRFIQADTIIPNPGNSQDLNRYTYTRNNPLKYNDPTGHVPWLALIALGIFITQIPGSTPQEVSPESAAIAQTALSVACEPCDWAFTAERWSRGDTHWTDLLGLLPVASATILRHSDELADLAKGARVIEDAGDVAGTTLRNVSGTVTGGENLATISGKWLKGTDGNVGRIPGQIAEQLNGQTFNNFDEFRQAFWKAVANDPDLVEPFTDVNRQLMAQGKAPYVVLGQQTGNGLAQVKYNLHHLQPLADGGGLYDLDNILVVTPRYHDVFTYGQ